MNFIMPILVALIGLAPLHAADAINLKGKHNLIENIKGECPEYLEVNTYAQTIWVGYHKSKGDIPVYSYGYNMENINGGTRSGSSLCWVDSPDPYYIGPCTYYSKTRAINENQTLTYTKGEKFTNDDAYFTDLEIRVEGDSIFFREKKFNLPLLVTAFQLTPLSTAIKYYYQWPMSETTEDMECRFDLIAQ